MFNQKIICFLDFDMKYYLDIFHEIHLQMQALYKSGAATSGSILA